MFRFVVERSRLCLDYSATVYFIHFIICSICDGHFDISNALLSLASSILTTNFGRKYCLEVELSPIPMGISSVENSLPRMDQVFKMIPSLHKIPFFKNNTEKNSNVNLLDMVKPEVTVIQS
jgi:hypothetical protein